MVMRLLQLCSIRVRWSWFTDNRSLRTMARLQKLGTGYIQSATKWQARRESGSMGNQLRTLPGKRNFSLKSRKACGGTTRNWL